MYSKNLKTQQQHSSSGRKSDHVSSSGTAGVVGKNKEGSGGARLGIKHNSALPSATIFLNKKEEVVIRFKPLVCLRFW